MIKFKYIRFMNFLSTGNGFTEIALDEHETTLISGANGAGKSTLLDALTYVLFKKPFRNINIPNLVNTINQKGLLVEVEFHIGVKTYLVRRGIKPNVFEVHVDGVMLPQSANSFDYQDNLEKNILRMNYKTFCQIVVLGSANFVPFMLLPPAVRREIIENLLDIDVFSKMNVILKNEAKKNDDFLGELTTKERLINSRISLMQKHIEELKNNNDGNIERLRNSVREIQKSLDERAERRQLAQKELDATSNQDGDISLELGKVRQTQDQLEKRAQKVEKEILEIQHLTSCPTCKQMVSKSQISIILETHNTLFDKITVAAQKIARNIQSLEKQEQAYQEVSANKLEIRNFLKVIDKEIFQQQTTLSSYEKQIEDLQASKKEIDTTELEKHIAAQGKIKAKKDESINKAELYAIAAQLLKDGGIKSMIISQYIPVMNKLINKYLEQMDFFCAFEIDENFKEVMKAVYKDEMCYTSLSQGERMRVDIALLFTWREIARMRNAALTNILILDEIMDSSLDAAGTDEFLNIIKTISKSSRIFVISHKADQIMDKFDHSIVFEKKMQFSDIVRAA